MESKGFDPIISIRKSEIEHFTRLWGKEHKDSPFHNKPKQVLFLLAMTLGYRSENQAKDISSGKKVKKVEWTRFSYLSPKEKTLMNSIAIASEEGGLKVLLDKKRVFQIAEQYAAGGIKLLREKVLSKDAFGSFDKIWENELNEEYALLKKEYPELFNETT